MHLLRHPLKPLLLFLGPPPVLDRLHSPVPLRLLLLLHLALERLGCAVGLELRHAFVVGGLVGEGSEGGAGWVPGFACCRGGRVFCEFSVLWKIVRDLGGGGVGAYHSFVGLLEVG